MQEKPNLEEITVDMIYSYATTDGYYTMNKESAIEVLEELTVADVEELLDGQKFMIIMMAIASDKSENPEEVAQYKEVSEKVENFIQLIKEHLMERTGGELPNAEN